jgi:hypothetical protein
MAYYTAGIVGSYFRDAVTPNGFDISGSTVRAGNFLMAGGGRFSDTSGNIDISGGNLSVPGTINAGAITSPGIAPTNIVVPGYIRDNILAPNMDISGANIRIAGSFIGSTATASNQIGGVTLSNTTLIATTMRNAATSFTIDMSGGTISNSVRILTGPGTVAAPSYSFGGDTAMGLYDPATNVLGLVTAGVERMRIAADGQVSIVSNLRFSTNGTASAPLIATTSLGTTGYYFAADAQPAICQGGNEITRWNGSGMRMAVAGTVTNPSIAWLSEQTGFSLPAAGRIAFLTTGTEKMTISNSNVGIGTTAPDSALHVVGGVIASTFVRNSLDASQFDISGGNIRNTGRIQTGTGYSLSLDAADSITGFSNLRTHQGSFVGINESQYLTNGQEWPLIYTHQFSNGIWTYKTGTTTGGLLFKTQVSGTTAERMRIGSNGNVGIGCNAPQNRLDLSMSSTFDGIRMTGPSPVINMYVRGSEANGNTLQFFANSTSGGITQFDGTRTLNLNTGINNTPRLVVGTNGNVAIGAGHINPEVPLDVSGTSDYLAVFRGSGGTQAGIWVTNGAGATTTTGIQLYQNATGQGLFTAGTNTQPMHFWTGATRRMTILNTGQVGIGTVAPATTLDISTSTDPGMTLRNRSGNATFRLLGGAIADTAGMQIYHGTSDQGIYVNNTLPFNIQSNGTNRLTIISNGNIGIGTANLSNYRLSIRGSGGSNGSIVFHRSSDDKPYVGVVYDETAEGIVFGVNTGANDLTCNAMFIKRANPNAGAVGIGTMLPGANLDVSGVLRVQRAVGGNNNLIAIATMSNSLPVIRHGIGIDPDTGVGNGGGDLFFNAYNNAGVQLSTPLMIRRSDASIGINTTDPKHMLDVAGTIRGSSNIVAVAVASNWVGTTTGVTDTSLTISYTPKQTGTVTLLIEGNADYITGAGTGFDGGVVQLRNNATVLTQYQIEFDQNYVVGRGTNSYAGGRLAFVSVTGTSLINMRVARSGDDSCTVRNGYLRVMELSTT